MRFHIQPSVDRSDRRTVADLERQAFEHENGIRLPDLEIAPGAPMMQYIVRLDTGLPAGALTVLETTGDTKTHLQYGVSTRRSERIARYTRLAVLPRFRSLGLPLRLLLEAHRHFVVPNGIGRTWLLFPAAKAAASSLVGVLGFVPSDHTTNAEYGQCRVLSRDEHSVTAVIGNSRGWQHLRSLDAESNLMHVWKEPLLEIRQTA